LEKERGGFRKNEQRHADGICINKAGEVYQKILGYVSGEDKI